MESWLENVDAKENDIREKTENLVVQKIAVVKTKFQIPINFVEKESGASITVPKEVFQKAKTKNGTNTSESQESIYFVYYKNNNFFRKKSVITKHCIDGYTVEEKTVYTPVLASGIVGKKVSNLSAPVVLKFKKGNRKVSLRFALKMNWLYACNYALISSEK